MGLLDLERVGGIDLPDLFAVCELLGMEGLPFPFFSRTQLEGFSGRDGAGSSVADRFHDGDLRAFRAFAEAYPRADVRVVCRVLDPLTDPHTPHTRLLALRAEQVGFLASQRADEDVVDVFSVSPYELGAAIAGATGLTGPGSRPRIGIPCYARHFRRPADTAFADDDYQVSVSVRVAASVDSGAAAVTTVPETEVVTLAAIQSQWQPPRAWGMDPVKKKVVWARVNDDGDYLYAPDFGHATPVTRQQLATRIDQLIAEDVAAIRHHRGIS